VTPEATSSARAPGGPWGRSWLAALGLALVALGSWEAFWRSQGHVPGSTDDVRLWCQARLSLASSPRAVAVLGDSRAQLGIDLGALGAGLRSELPVQLAIQGSTPIPVLRDLAADGTFHGLALLAVSPLRFFSTGGDSATLPSEYLAAAAQRLRSPASAAELRLQAALDDVTILRKVELSPLMLLRVRRWPVPRAVHADRSRPQHFVRDERLLAVEREQTALLRGLSRPRGPALEAMLSDLAPTVRRIELRGGRVVLVRMPSSDLHRQLERDLSPRELYWDALVRATGAPAIHFEDWPELRGFHCPDGSHLDAADAPSFTRALAGRIRGELRRVGDARFD